jgi:hypothetical protein
MMTANSPQTIDIVAALRDPGRYFPEPQDVVNAIGLDQDTKLKLLEEWERDARGLAVAEEEGLSDGEASMLRRIRQARRALTGDETPDTSSPTKHGG